MSIHAFPAPAVLPVVEAARELVTSGAAVGLASVGDGEVGEVDAGLAALEAQAQAWRLALEAEADQRALAEKDAATGTVRVIVNAAEQIPATATAAQVAMAEQWLVAQGTGDGTRDPRPRDAKRLRRAAHRMCAPISHELMTAHQDLMLGREHASRRPRPGSASATTATAPGPGSSSSPHSTASSCNATSTPSPHHDGSPATVTVTR